jgi:methionyl-tRNA synthetase
MNEHRDPAAKSPAEASPAAPGSPVPTPNASGRDGAGELLSIEEFQRWDIRVARVVTAELHPRADRLLKLTVDVGGEERPLVAGIAAHYRPEDLVGRLIVVVANLKPARLRGEESCGMLLAASAGEVVSLLTPDQALPPGARVK